ncbi:DUF4349 domain-containing protein [Streptomyces sp. V3I7]|uniref:DUF4349 domain-containing protein n=1 Tax=Streptomyces sp. V3I7 TaxID=3042278 RepID=UPI00277D35B3|nr:DUF4349 domain-containing protein [Streptomyces sp. V3I7]MDQ0993646.1 hypothetical protein [Streptomyces sp. V3I7]
MRARHSVRPVPVRALTGVLIAASLALAGCSAGSDSSGAKTADAASAGRPGAGGDSDGKSGGGPTVESPRLTPNGIIRTASLTVRVKDASAALADARTTAENAGGYVGDENTNRDSDGHERTRVVLRVPTAAYDEVLNGLQGAGKLISRTASAKDVSDQVVDVESRIKSQRASVARVRELMDKATRLSDVVALEGELSTREANLEALLAQQASLKDRTSVATITLTLTETPVKGAAKDDTPSFLDAVSGGWHVFVTMLRWITLVLGAVLPFAVLAGLIAFLWARFVRPRLARPAAAAPTAPAPAAPGPLPMARPVPDDDED